MAVNRLGVGRISFPFGIDNDLKIALEDFVNRTSDTTDYLLKPRVASISADYTASDLDSVVLVDATSAGITVTLPDATVVSGKNITIKKTDASANAVTVDGNGSQKIDGATTASLASQNKYISIVSDGTNWHIVANN